MRRKLWRAGDGMMPLAQDYLTESQGEEKEKLGGAEGRVRTLSSYEAGEQR